MQSFSNIHSLYRARDLAGTEAPCTHVDMARSPVDDRLDTADIRLPGPVGTAVGVGNLDPEAHALAANIALCHFSCTSLS